MVKDKVAIVTGASSGIGYATALALSKGRCKSRSRRKAHGQARIVTK